MASARAVRGLRFGVTPRATAAKRAGAPADGTLGHQLGRLDSDDFGWLSAAAASAAAAAADGVESDELEEEDSGAAEAAGLIGKLVDEKARQRPRPPPSVPLRLQCRAPSPPPRQADRRAVCARLGELLESRPELKASYGL
jgi:hypothetical protein